MSTHVSWQSVDHVIPFNGAVGCKEKIVPSPTAQLTQKAVWDVLRDVSSTKLKKVSELNRVEYLAELCEEALLKTQGVAVDNKARRYIIQLIYSPLTPISNKVFDCLILDEDWQQHIWRIGFHEYQGLLLHSEIKDFKQELISLTPKEIKRNIKKLLSKHKKPLKDYLKSHTTKTRESKLNYLVAYCRFEFLKPKIESFKPSFIDLTDRKIPRLEAAQLGLPGGRNMLKEFIETSSLASRMYEAETNVSSVFYVSLKKEIEQLEAQFRVELETPEQLKKMKI